MKAIVLDKLEARLSEVDTDAGQLDRFVALVDTVVCKAIDGVSPDSWRDKLGPTAYHDLRELEELRAVALGLRSKRKDMSSYLDSMMKLKAYPKAFIEVLLSLKVVSVSGLSKDGIALLVEMGVIAEAGTRVVFKDYIAETPDPEPPAPTPGTRPEPTLLRTDEELQDGAADLVTQIFGSKTNRPFTHVPAGSRYKFWMAFPTNQNLVITYTYNDNGTQESLELWVCSQSEFKSLVMANDKLPQPSQLYRKSVENPQNLLPEIAWLMMLMPKN